MVTKEKNRIKRYMCVFNFKTTTLTDTRVCSTSLVYALQMFLPTFYTLPPSYYFTVISLFLWFSFLCRFLLHPDNPNLLMNKVPQNLRTKYFCNVRVQYEWIVFGYVFYLFERKIRF